jgi:hypothetical protein
MYLGEYFAVPNLGLENLSRFFSLSSLFVLRNEMGWSSFLHSLILYKAVKEQKCVALVNVFATINKNKKCVGLLRNFKVLLFRIQDLKIVL